MNQFIPLADQQTIGDELHRWRRNQRPKVTLEDMQEKTGISVSKVSLFERGLKDLSGTELASILELVRGVKAKPGVLLDEAEDDVT